MSHEWESEAERDEFLDRLFDLKPQHECPTLPNYYILTEDKRFWKDVYTNALVENKKGNCAFCGKQLEEGRS